MAGKLLDDKHDYLIQEHRAGRTAGDLAREFGVTHKVIVRVLGSEYRPGLNLPVDDVVKSYIAGESCNSIAKRYEVSRRAVDRVLGLAGVTMRTQSESETIKWSKMTEEQRAKQTAAAHDAARGRIVSFEEKCKRAQTNQYTLPNVSSYELQLMEMLDIKGIEYVPQFAIGPYNCDIAIHPVAVEVWGGGWHFSGHHLARTPDRFRYIMNAGWFILALVVDDTFPLTPAVADYVDAFVQEASGCPTELREYRVVWGAGEFTTGGYSDDDHITVVPPFTNRRDPTTGRYETVAR